MSSGEESHRRLLINMCDDASGFWHHRVMASDSSGPLPKNPPTDENSQKVEIWESHPKQPQISQYWPTSAPDRRRPENAKMRHWMTLGEQALRDQEITDHPDDDSTQLDDQSSDVNGKR